MEIEIDGPCWVWGRNGIVQSILRKDHVTVLWGTEGKVNKVGKHESPEKGSDSRYTLQEVRP